MFDTSELSQIIHQFHFMRPWWLLTMAPFMVFFALQWRSETRLSSWQKYLPEHLRDALTVGDTGWKRQLPIAILFLVVIFVILVCSGPTWKKEISPFHQDETPLVVVLDSGVAMQEKDVAPDRLTRAKQKVEDLLQQRNGGKNALIAYSGSAHLAMPLTKDISVFKPMLEVLGPDVMPIEGKNSAAAVRLVKEQLKGSPVAGTVLLITNDVTAESVSAWREYLQQSKTQLLILAAGNIEKQSDIPLRLDELEQFSADVNGTVIPLSVDNSDIETIIRRVENHASFNTQNDQPWQDMGYSLLIPIMLLVLLWFRRGWVVQWALAGILVNSLLIGGLLVAPNQAQAKSVHSFADGTQSSPSNSNASLSLQDKVMQSWLDLWMTRDQQGQWYFDRGEYLKAANHYQDPLRKGVAFYYASQYSSSFKVLNQSQDFTMQLHAVSALARQREYVAARTVLTHLMKTHPNNEVVKHNLKIINAVIKEINDFSESQSKGPEAGDDASHELGNKPQTADGVKTEVIKQLLLKDKMTAEQLLANDASVDKWFKRVESNPKSFLRSKFGIQYQKQQQGMGER